MDAKDAQRPIVTIGGQEVSLDARRGWETGPGQAGELKVALEPAAERVVYEIDRVPGRWWAGIVIALLSLAGLGVLLAVLLTVRALLRKRLA